MRPTVIRVYCLTCRLTYKLLDIGAATPKARCRQCGGELSTKGRAWKVVVEESVSSGVAALRRAAGWILGRVRKKGAEHGVQVQRQTEQVPATPKAAESAPGYEAGGGEGGPGRPGVEAAPPAIAGMTTVAGAIEGARGRVGKLLRELRKEG